MRGTAAAAATDSLLQRSLPQQEGVQSRTDRRPPESGRLNRPTFRQVIIGFYSHLSIRSSVCLTFPSFISLPTALLKAFLLRPNSF